MIALPLTLLSLAWAISLVLPGVRNRDGQKSLHIWEITLVWLVGALAIGVLRATNTWDYPTYLFIGSLAAAYFVYQYRGRISIRTVGIAAVAVLSLIALSILLFLPFVDNYGLPYSSFSPWSGSYTQLSNYLIIYGLFLLFIITFLVAEFRGWTKTWTQQSLSAWEPFVLPVFLGLLTYVGLSAFLLLKGYWIAPTVLLLVLTAGLLALRPKLAIERRIVLILISGALALTLIVEFIVLDGDIGRMNTVFKFYLQVWVLLSIASAAIAVWVWPAIMERKTVKVVWTVSLALLLAAAALYPILATKAKWDIRMSDEAPTTLDGMAFMKTTSYADAGPNGNSQTINLDFDYQAIQWMQRNIEGSPVIVEAHSKNPYRAAANRVSMYTGLPTIIGWDWHQRQQRALLPASIVGDRIFDVDSLYNTIDPQEAMDLINKYDVSYIYVGPLEWTYYNPQGLVKFDQMVETGLLREIYRNEGVSIYEVTG
jgi:YYY domain-containing protein